jgi:hypothetical protein
LRSLSPELYPDFNYYSGLSRPPMSDDTKPPDPTSKRAVDPRRFWVVWSPQGGPPVARIASFEEARAAAQRLSNRKPEQDFFVLASCWGKRGTPAEPVLPEPETEGMVP